MSGQKKWAGPVPPGQKKGIGPAPTVEQIQSDIITQLANEYWAPHSNRPRSAYNKKIIDEIYQRELVSSKFGIRRVMLLEFSQYLENYLWPNYTEQSSKAHMMSIVTMVNEKFRERVPAWEPMKKEPKHFAAFVRRIFEASLETTGYSMKEQTVLLIFVIHIFNSLEVDLIRKQIQGMVGFSMWTNLLPGRRAYIFKNQPKYEKIWSNMMKRDSQIDAATKVKKDFDRNYLYRLIQKYYQILDSIPAEGAVSADKAHYCERFMELMVDLQSLPIIRRYFNTLMDDTHVVVRSTQAPIAKREDGTLFTELLDMLRFYTHFQINDQTGDALTDDEMDEIHYKKVNHLQIGVFKHFREKLDEFSELKRFALINVGSIDSRENLSTLLKPLDNQELQQLATHCNLVPSEKELKSSLSREYLLELLITHHERTTYQLEGVNKMPLYPTEEIIWDENVVPMEYYSGEGCLALPKLHLQFLTLHDYLLRNFKLFRLESTYEIRQDIEDSVIRTKPWKSEDDSCYFGGWARMAHPIEAFNVVEVAKPNLGEEYPARVRADVTVNLNLRPEIKHEWESLRKHDVAFLMTLRPPNAIGTPYKKELPFVTQVGLLYVRGCEIEGMLDAEGRVIEEGPDPKPELRGDTRTFRVWLDSNQYQQDMAETVHSERDIYSTFNLIMRRKPKENNFKAVLETIRDLMNTQCVVPDWLRRVILGLGDPGTAHYKMMPNQISKMNWNDTFLSSDHLRSCFPDYRVEFPTSSTGGEPKPPFRLIFNDAFPHDGSVELPKEKVIKVEPHIIPNRGPYPYNQPKKNSVPFTPTQIEAIRAGMQPGLTMVVGPPGTGKTDVAVQIISNLYHNFPDQRTLIVTHSNQALNQLFEKIIALDIEERHLLRLGHGEEALETEKDFSRYGRVNYVLGKRLELLEEVRRLQSSMNVPGDVGYTCETAAHFHLYHVIARWEEFLSKTKYKKGKDAQVEDVATHFPFVKYFENAPQPLFKERTYAEDMDIAEGCYRYIEQIFTQLKDFRSFELLRSGAERSRYLLVKEAKIIAMTCTHAALKRRDLVEADFQYDNILMEESAQILEIETFIPLLLQNPITKDRTNRLKRWIMIGDHHQLPPVIKNMAFQKFSNMEQSLFTRFVHYGVPTVDLDAQGRARASLCNLYNWRYKKLGNLPHVSNWAEYRTANAGFFFDFQLIDVGDFNRVGESEPNPYFYQNLAEAEYIVAVFMYMRLLGYPANKISMLTTYNGQKHLIRDVIQQRCADNPLIGRPHKVTTVDRFQGQQNDYILLSLVRTRAVGHLRDVRRLVVAMSRARLGLYVFARVSLFENCFELTPAFNKLMLRPTKLHLSPSEPYPTTRKHSDAPYGPPLIMEDMPQMAQFVYDFYCSRVEQLMRQQGYRNAPKPLSQPTFHSGRQSKREPRQVEHDNPMEEHPGADSDSDEEGTDKAEPKAKKTGQKGKKTIVKSQIPVEIQNEVEGMENSVPSKRSRTEDTKETEPDK